MSIGGKQTRRRWNVQEIKILLKCYLAHKEEFVHSHKRLAYKHVLDDMIAEGFDESSITILT
ncbi:unnamed protein product [Ceratitis capitata]|uniref:(Mediterranean fruit fly) hypothetical protein n=1 Tax=Ceratitis capitata TaxID=7213 RepID=A0A811UNE8_CERCA|nr:unnamed protein product [Ceratitis capitata]